MNSYTLRNIVKQTKSIIETNDLTCKENQTQLEITELAKLLNLKFKFNEKTILAIVKHLSELGFKLENNDCNHTRRLLVKCKNVESLCCRAEIDNLKTVCASLFNQQIRGC